MKHYAFLIPSILSFTLLAACGDDDSSFAPRDTDDSSSSICDDCDDESSSSGKGTATNSSDSRDGNSSSSGDLSKYDFVWDTFAEAFNTTCDASREGQVGLARYAEDSELICTHDEYLDKWGWLSPSSSSEASSSSAAQSSSSINLRVPECKTESEDNCVYDSLTDARDGKTYKTVIIGEQEWMAENLNYEAENSYCYNDQEKNCNSFGRLYTWDSALTICPEGWHLPTVAEFDILLASVSGGSKAHNKAHTILLNNQSNDYGFSAYTGGFRNSSGTYSRMGDDANFWSATENDDDNAFRLCLNWLNSAAYLWDAEKESGVYVRCLKGKSSKQDAATEATYSGSYGTLTDERDGQTYKTVIIGDQTWMAENLKRETENSVCYGEDSENCEKFGRLYQWSTAMDSAGTWSKNGAGCGYRSWNCKPTYPVRGVCPEGWHLPSYTEFEALIETIGDRTTAGRKLKSKTDWKNERNGTDAYGFAALPAGYEGFSLDSLNVQGISANFWSSTKDDDYAYRLYILYSDDDVGLSIDGVGDNLSVRCVKD